MVSSALGCDRSQPSSLLRSLILTVHLPFPVLKANPDLPVSPPGLLTMTMSPDFCTVACHLSILSCLCLQACVFSGLFCLCHYPGRALCPTCCPQVWSVGLVWLPRASLLPVGMVRVRPSVPCTWPGLWLHQGPVWSTGEQQAVQKGGVLSSQWLMGAGRRLPPFCLGWCWGFPF